MCSSLLFDVEIDPMQKVGEGNKNVVFAIELREQLAYPFAHQPQLHTKLKKTVKKMLNRFEQ